MPNDVRCTTANWRAVLLRASGPVPSGRQSRPAPAPEPATSGISPPRTLTMLPPALLFAAILCFGAGMVLGQVPVVAFGLALAIFGGISFVLVPVLTMARSRR